MAQIAILSRKCTDCGICLNVCPFHSIQMVNELPEIDAGCRLCGICIKNCPSKAIIKLETKAVSVDKSLWNDILVFVEVSGGTLHPVSLELIGKAQALASCTPHKVRAVVLGENVMEFAQELRHYAVDEVIVYDDRELSYFRADAYAAAIEDAINLRKPSIVLIGATALGRSLAPRLSTRFHTGLTADCTKLELMENSDLVQIRPAFGGNIMAQILTPNTRPQFATVRYKVMDAPIRQEMPIGEIIMRKTPKTVYASQTQHVSTTPIPRSTNISDSEILVVGGRGIQKESDMTMIKELASLLGGDYAVTRTLVEKGWETNMRQIGLSGRTVRPKLIITCGVSGAIQFTACMNSSEHIIAINTDPEAPIFKVAHVGIVGDLYEILPKLIASIKSEVAV